MVGEHSVIQGDALAVLRTLPDASISAVLSDPPYGISFMGNEWDHGVPSADVWREMLRVCKPGAPLISFGGTRTYHRLACAIEDAGWEIRDCLSWLYGSGFPKSLDVAKQPGCEHITGYGTALKPAWEPCVLARKPLDGTVAYNVLTHGVGALNVDGCRLPGLGRWPANVCLDEEAAAILDAQSGERPSTLTGRAAANGRHSHPASVGRTRPSMFGNKLAGGHVYADSGGASRFFYTAKVSKREREFGCESLPRSEGATVSNNHPTLKPISLAHWLAKLILPPSSGERHTLLVPYSGAGSEMIGALTAGWPSVIGIEQSAEYVAIANARIAAHAARLSAA